MWIPNIRKHTNPLVIATYKMKKRQLWHRGFRRHSSLQAAWDTSIARTIIIVTFHLADISIVICRWEAPRDVFCLLLEFKAIRPLNTPTLPCRTYTIPTHSFGVRMDKTPQSFIRQILLYLTHSGRYPIDYEYWSVSKLGCCVSIPIARCNGTVWLSINS